jgi:acetylornithine deacetylase/succinyl-diaminopimelate desuccinylase-like protein
VVDALTVLSATAAPHGRELRAANALVAWGRDAHPGLGWDVEPCGDSGANVVVTCVAPGGRGGSEGAPALLLCSHLDTSLTGDPAHDAAITGRDDAVPPLRTEHDTLVGPGLGVARGPAAAALVGLVLAAERLQGREHAVVRVLLAGSGTHRSALAPSGDRGATPSSSAGVLHHLDSATALPAAAVVAKSGPPALLRAEPGSGYLRVVLRGTGGPAMLPSLSVPPGGLLPHAGTLLDAVARWRTSYVGARTGRPDGIGGQVGLGAMTAGAPDKADLLPAVLDLRLYLVTVPGDDVQRIGDGLATALRRDLRGTALGACAVEVTAEALQPAGSTSADAMVVRRAHDAWTRHLGSPPERVRDWTGSTDGVVLRARGIDTVRAGPRASADVDDPRLDRMSLKELAAFARLYADLAVEHATS